MSFVTKMFGGDKKVDTAGAQFTPYSISGTSGGVKFDQGAKTGQVNLSPELQSLYDQYMGGASSMLPSAGQQQFATDIGTYGQGMFTNAANLDINKMTSDYFSNQINLLAPQRNAEDVRLQEQLYGTGRTGAGTFMGGGYVNPQQYAAQLAREHTDAGLLLGAEDRARGIQNQDMTSALGWYGLGQELRGAPYQQSAGIAGLGLGLESGFASPYLGYGVQSGQASATAGANIANMQQQQNQSNLGFWGGLISGGLGMAGKVFSGPGSYLDK